MMSKKSHSSPMRSTCSVPSFNFFLGAVSEIHRSKVFPFSNTQRSKVSAGLDHTPATINEHMVDLLCRTTSVGIPSPAMSLWVLKPITSHPNSTTSCKVKELSAIVADRWGPTPVSQLSLSVPVDALKSPTTGSVSRLGH